MSGTAWVALGGVAGAVARYWLAGIVQQLASSEFPYGTLVVNLLGSFVVGVVLTLSFERGLLGHESRLLLATGFCGGFTTMSTFSFETLMLLRHGQPMLALGNVGASVVGCLAAVWLGQLLARMV